MRRCKNKTHREMIDGLKYSNNKHLTYQGFQRDSLLRPVMRLYCCKICGNLVSAPILPWGAS